MRSPWQGNFGWLPSDAWKSRAEACGAVAVQLALFAVGFALALAVRFDFALTTPRNVAWFSEWFLPLLPLILAIKLAVWVLLGLQRGGVRAWRYVSLKDAVRLVVASQIALALLFTGYYAWQTLSIVIRHRPASIAGIPETVFLLDWLFSLVLLGGARMIVRLLYEESRPVASGGLVRLLLIGTGDAAQSVLREIARMPEQRYRVVGLLDENEGPVRPAGALHGVPVLGHIASLPRVCAEHQIGEILIALPSATNHQMQRIVSLCRATQMAADMRGDAAGVSAAAAFRFRTVPSFQDIVAGKAMANQIRDVSVNDLLGRDVVNSDLAAVGALVHAQVVLVSGAGGSIGSELCRTIAAFEPAVLLLVDKAENAVFEIDRELKKSHPMMRCVPLLADISDPVRVEQIFTEYQPAIVFHAAAHKHVPLAESNPGEAIRNNVFGTRTLADAAAAGGVKNFVMISTDKAVNPSSIMGATKRCAEIYIQALARRCQTNFITVRFGNVLGSNGSVVPIFKQQIAAGGPVTVTHPEMRRYFMTIPEAAQLVLQAGALGERGEIFVLDMGQPVGILDLARDLIILTGLRPDVDIPIVFTGLRPGEKLYEELSIKGENMAATRHPKIAIWKSRPAANQHVQNMIDELEPLQHCTSRHQILAALQQFVPEMKPWQAESSDMKSSAPQIRKVAGEN